MKSLFLTLFFAFSLILSQTYAQNNALKFDGVNDRVFGSMSTLPQGNAARTIEAWIKYSSGNDLTIFNYGTPSNNQMFTLHLYSGVYIIGYNNDLSTGYSVNDGLWHHVAVTHDGTTTKVYVDGTQRGSKTTTYNTTGTSFQIGASYRTSYIFHFTGTIDEVRVWNVARTQAEIQASMNQALSAGTGLIAAFHFNETSGTIAADALGSNNGSLNNFDFNASSGWIMGTILPVEMINFEGKNREGSIWLTWQTASENQNNGFDIERSTDGVDFDKIGFVGGNGTTIQKQNYFFIDGENLDGIAYYRLKQLDFNGDFKYSKIISIDRTSKAIVNVFPNPSTGIFNIIGSKNIENNGFMLQNSIGQTMSVNIQANGQLDLSAYPSGTYYLYVESSGQVIELLKE